MVKKLTRLKTIRSNSPRVSEQDKLLPNISEPSELKLDGEPDDWTEQSNQTLHVSGQKLQPRKDLLPRKYKTSLRLYFCDEQPFVCMQFYVYNNNSNVSTKKIGLHNLDPHLAWRIKA